jgi:hypothetical protein
MNWKSPVRAAWRVWWPDASSSSVFILPKKLSQMALSYASPTEPIEGRTSASRQRRPNSIEVYWADSSSRRNAVFVG